MQDPRPQKYTLPDGQVFSITTEGVQLGEALLQPALMTVEDAELPEALVSQVQQHPDAGMRKVSGLLLTKSVQGHTCLFICSLLQGACRLPATGHQHPVAQQVFSESLAQSGKQYLRSPWPALGHRTLGQVRCHACFRQA